MDPPRWASEFVREQKQKLLGTPPVRQQQAPWRERSLSSKALFVTPCCTPPASADTTDIVRR